jgi:hypothetical protein
MDTAVVAALNVAVLPVPIFREKEYELALRVLDRVIVPAAVRLPTLVKSTQAAVMATKDEVPLEITCKPFLFATVPRVTAPEKVTLPVVPRVS